MSFSTTFFEGRQAKNSQNLQLKKNSIPNARMEGIEEHVYKFEEKC